MGLNEVQKGRARNQWAGFSQSDAPVLAQQQFCGGRLNKDRYEENNEAAMVMLMLTGVQSIRDSREGSTNYFSDCLLVCSFSKP